MDQFRWILLGVAIAAIAVVYFLSRTRKNAHKNQPLDAANDVPAFSADENLNDDWVDGVGPVKVVSQSDQAIIESFEEAITVPDTLDVDNPFPGNMHEVHEFDMEVPEEELHAAEVQPEDQIPQAPETPEQPDQAIDDVIAVFVLVSPDDTAIKGEKILSASFALDLKYGDMKIFHRYANSASVKEDDAELANEEILFSMANMMEPGWFDFDKMHEMETSGISFFMQANLVNNPSAVLDDMLICAHRMATMIGAQLCNSQRKPLDEAHTNELRDKVKKLVELKAHIA